MALIQCCECGASISDKAAACPKCGAPVIQENSDYKNDIEKKSTLTEFDNPIVGVAQKGTESRKIKKKPFIIFAILIVVVGVVAFLLFSGRGFFAQEISLSEKQIYLGIGDIVELQYVITPAFSDTGVVEWYSDEPEIASVNDGTITGKGNGQATISVKTPNKKIDSCKIVSASIIDKWEFEFVYSEGKKYDYESLVSYFSVEKDEATFKDYLGDTYTGTWKYEETRDNVDIYSFDVDGLNDYIISVSDSDLTISLEGTTDIVFFFARK